MIPNPQDIVNRLAWDTLASNLEAQAKTEPDVEKAEAMRAQAREYRTLAASAGATLEQAGGTWAEIQRFKS